MIKGDVQISEPAATMPPIQFRNEIEANLPIEENIINTLMADEADDKSEVKNHFSRLKRRMRGSSSGIF